MKGQSWFEASIGFILLFAFLTGITAGYLSTQESRENFKDYQERRDDLLKDRYLVDLECQELEELYRIQTRYNQDTEETIDFMKLKECHL